MAESTASEAPFAGPGNWNEMAEAYQAYNHDFLARYATQALNALNLSANDRLLDVAAGTGAASLQAVERGCRVYAVDFAEAMVERLRSASQKLGYGPPQLETGLGDGQALTLASDAFDAAISNFGLMFFPRRDLGFGELRRVLRSGGRAAITAWAPPAESALITTLMPAVRQALAAPASASRPVRGLENPDNFRAEFEAAGFVDVEIRPISAEFLAASPAELWDAMEYSCPAVVALRTIHGAAAFNQHREAIVEALTAQLGDGPVRLSSPALLGLGKAP